MKVRVLRDEFILALTAVGHAVPDRAIIDATLSVLIRANDGAVEILATDTSTAIERRMVGEVTGNGEVLVPFRPLMSFVGALRGETVELSQEGTRVMVRGETEVARLSSGDISTFPAVSFESTKTFKVSGAALVSQLNALLPLINPKELRPIGGINFNFTKDPDALEMTVLSEVHCGIARVDCEVEAPTSFIINLKQLQALASVIKKETDITIGVGSLVSFVGKNTSVAVSPTQSDYVDYRRLAVANIETFKPSETSPAEIYSKYLQYSKSVAPAPARVTFKVGLDDAVSAFRAATALGGETVTLKLNSDAARLSSDAAYGASESSFSLGERIDSNEAIALPVEIRLNGQDVLLLLRSLTGAITISVATNKAFIMQKDNALMFTMPMSGK